MSKVLFIQLGGEMSALLKSRAMSGRNDVEETTLRDFSALALEGEDGADIDAIVLGEGVDEPISLSQRIHLARRQIPILILASRERCGHIDRAIQFTPFLGKDVACYPTSEPEDVAEELRLAIQKSRKRRRYEETIAAVSVRRASAVPHRPLQPLDSLFFERLLNYAPIGILSVDMAGRVMTWNPRAAEILGVRVSDMLGASLQELLRAADASISESISEWIARDTGESAKIVERHGRGGEGQWLEVGKAPVSGRHGEEGVLVLLQDVTGRISAEARLKAALEREQEAREKAEDAVRTRDEFISLASHELKTPITALQLQNQVNRRLLQRDAGDSVAPSQVEQMIELSARQLGNLSALVEEMLDVSRIASGKLSLAFSETDLVALARDVCARMSVAAREAGCKLQTLDAGEPVTGCWDAGRIEQVLQNLLSNAFKYGAGKPVSIEIESEGDLARIRVTDQGEGVARRDQRRIFLQYERAVSMKNIGGFGLGLFIARRIVEEHGGGIGVRSEPGKGACFWVELPLSPPGGAT